jgi:peptide/nickel transport system substrate-binding protein
VPRADHLRLLLLGLLLILCGCAQKPDPHTLVMIIESSPANLDPRVGTDAQSERISKLIFDPLVRRDEHFNLQPCIAESWQIRDPLTYIFHLRGDVRFHNGQKLTSRDVKWTFDSVLNGSIITAKAGTFNLVDRVDAPDDYTVIFHLKEPWSALLWNLSDAALQIVPYGSGPDFNQKLIGSGPFKFVSQELDNYVELARNDDYWGEKPRIERVRFNVVPDTTTRALELRKGSADVAINTMPPDMVQSLRGKKSLEVMVTPGTTYQYLAFNLRDPVLRDVRVRQAIAYSIDRRAFIHFLWRDLAEPASTVLPPQHWAYDSGVRQYDHDPARANQLLDAAGYKPGRDGIRFHLTMKTSTEETTRLLAAVLQQQLRSAGIALDIRTFEFATFYSDVQKGAFQLYSLRWIGGNEDPDIFEAVFSSHSFPPARSNRGYYSNPEADALIDAGRRELDQQKRTVIYKQLQELLSRDLPYVSLWYLDNVLVRSRRVRNIQLSPSGNYDFLRTAELAP